MVDALALPSARPKTHSSACKPRGSVSTANRETIRAHERALAERRERRLRLGLLGLREHMLLLLLLLLCHLGLHLVSQKASEQRNALLDIRVWVLRALRVALRLWEAQYTDASSTPVL